MNKYSIAQVAIVMCKNGCSDDHDDRHAKCFIHNFQSVIIIEKKKLVMKKVCYVINTHVVSR